MTRRQIQSLPENGLPEIPAAPFFGLEIDRFSPRLKKSSTLFVRYSGSVETGMN